MELEGFKSAWQNQSTHAHDLSSAHISRSLRFVRTSAIRDLQRSEEWSRLIFCLLFSLVAVGVSFVVLAPGAARIGTLLFAAALVVDGITGVVLLAHRLREPATTTVLEFISREHRQIETRLRFERYSQRLMIVLAIVALLLLVFAPRPAGAREGAMDVLVRMAIITSFLAVAWRRAKSRSKDVRSELERYLNDLEK